MIDINDITETLVLNKSYRYLGQSDIGSKIEHHRIYIYKNCFVISEKTITPRVVISLDPNDGSELIHHNIDVVFFKDVEDFVQQIKKNLETSFIEFDRAKKIKKYLNI